MAQQPDRSRRRTLHARLRAETQDLHDRLEIAVDAESRIASQAGYIDYLQRLWRLHDAVEHELCARDFSTFGFDYSTRRRAPFLQADLRALAVPLSPSARPDVPTLPTFAAPPTALGAVYVIEGSALGARVLLKHISTTLGLDAATGASFFAGRPAEDKLMWRNVLAALAAIDPESSDADAAVAGARSMFELFLAELPEPTSAPLLTRTG